MGTTTPPWERQPAEPPKAFRAFALYRDLGSRRSLDAVCRQLYRTQTGRKRASTGCVQEWSRRWRWVSRAAAWDDETDRRACNAEIKAFCTIGQRHAREACACQERALRRLEVTDWSDVTIPQAMKIYVEAVQIEREARGAPDHKTQGR
jgi:hypothetical protein